MLIWSGRGILAALVFLGMLILGTILFYGSSIDYAFVIAGFVAAIFSWYFGNKWNAKPTKILVDQKTGKEHHIKPNHSLFFVPMQYWGILFSVLAIIILFQNSFILGITATLLVLGIVTVAYSLKPKKKVSVSKSAVSATPKQSNSINPKVAKTNSYQPSQKTVAAAAPAKAPIAAKSFEPSDHSRFMPK